MKEDLKIYKMENPEHLQKPWHRRRSLTRAPNSKTPPAKTLCSTHQGDTMHSMKYAFLMILCVGSGRLASTAHTLSPETCKHARQQVNRIKHLLTNESFTPTSSTSGVISTEKVSRKSKCEVLQELNDYCNCEEAFQKDGNTITSETRSLIENLQMLKRSKDEKLCNLSDPSCPSEIQQLSSWEKYIDFQKLIRECLQIIQHVCPKVF